MNGTSITSASGVTRAGFLAGLTLLATGFFRPARAQMPGMQGNSPILNLKQAPMARRVVAVQHCKYGALYTLTFVTGGKKAYAEINLRLKLDSTDNGPPAKQAVLLPAGMVGDRASLVFASLEDLTDLVKEQC